MAAANLTADLAARLQSALEQEAVPALSHPQWVERNMAVDYVLAEACGNRLYRAILEPILKLTQEIVLKVKPPHTVIHDHAEHEAIVRAVLAGDGPGAGEAMSRHLSRIGQSLADLEADYRRRTGSGAGRTSG